MKEKKKKGLVTCWGSYSTRESHQALIKASSPLTKCPVLDIAIWFCIFPYIYATPCYRVYHLLRTLPTSNMAGSPVAAVVSPLGQSVQEMSMNGNEPPPQYFLKENSIHPMDSFLPSDPIPIIDISLLSSSSSLSSRGGEEEELQKLKSALTSWGCFQVLVSAYSKSL